MPNYLRFIPRRRSAAIAAASLLFQIILPERVGASDWYTGAAPVKPSNDWIVAVDASTSVTSTGSEFVAVAGTIAVASSLNVSGPRFRIEGLAGTYKFDSGDAAGRTITGNQAGGAFLAGYQWKSPTSSYSLFGGIDIRDSHFSGQATGLPAAGIREGFKGSVEYYGTPIDRTMVFAYGSYSTIYNAYYGRMKFGIAAAGPIFLGPEIAALGDDFYRQWRVGAHATGIQLGTFQFGLSAGYLSDKTGKGGGYGSLDVRAVY